ncbi:MAG: hypothetical protein RL226_965 [Bacteroidota bacterium]
MKKAMFLFAAALIGVTSVQAQKQIGGDKNIEVQFAPLGGSPISISGIRFRTFLDESSAFRVNLFVGSTSEETITAQEGEFSASNPVSPMLTSTDKTFDFSIQPGYEIHFDGTDRLSPYVGAEIVFGMGNMSTEEENWGPNDIDNAGEPEKYVVWTETNKDSYTTFGFNLVTGFDFYFADNVYLGAEMGFGFAKTNEGDSTVELSDLVAYNLANGLASDEDAPVAIVNGSSSAFGPNVNARIRLGWLFN